MNKILCDEDFFLGGGVKLYVGSDLDIYRESCKKESFILFFVKTLCQVFLWEQIGNNFFCIYSLGYDTNLKI